jgi:RNA polymerase sigma factor (sigma-70 family)
MMQTLNNMNGQLVLESLVACKRDVVEIIYKECYPSVRHMITSNSGNIYDAEDIFHDAIMLVLEKARKNSLELTCSLKTYLYAVCFNLWQNQLIRKSREVTFNGDIEFIDTTDDDQKILDEKQYEIFRQQFDKLNPKYQKILNMYLSKYPMKKITSEMGYANEKYAKVKKYMCKEILKKNIFNDPGFRELSLIASN